MAEKENMNNLAIKFLNSIKRWVDKRIPERTQECLRTKIAIIISSNNDNTFNVILAGDYGTYLDLLDNYNNGDIIQEEFNARVEMLIINELVTIKTDTYNIGDYVIIGYVDNKLTNSFIIYKTSKKGV